MSSSVQAGEAKQTPFSRATGDIGRTTVSSKPGGDEGATPTAEVPLITASAVTGGTASGAAAPAGAAAADCSTLPTGDRGSSGAATSSPNPRAIVAAGGGL